MMLEPQIAWFVRRDSDDSYEENSEYFAGSYNQEDDLTVEFMIWNNRYGSSDCEDLRNFGVTMSFDYEEDSVLFKYCQFLLNGTLWIVPQINGNEATIAIPENIILSGTSNDGSLSNSDHYLTLRLVLTVPADKNIKMNDRKGLTLNLTNL